jgi:hypothetical protein
VVGPGQQASCQACLEAQGRGAALDLLKGTRSVEGAVQGCPSEAGLQIRSVLPKNRSSTTLNAGLVGCGMSWSPTMRMQDVTILDLLARSKLPSTLEHQLVQGWAKCHSKRTMASRSP